MSRAKRAEPVELIDAIYATITAPETWPKVLEATAKWLGAGGALMLSPSLPGAPPVPLFSYGLDFTPILAAFPKFAGRATFTTLAIATGRVPGAFLLDELMSPAEQASDSFWQEIVAPLGVSSGIFVMVRTPEEGERAIIMNYYRLKDEAPFTAADVKDVERLIVHFRRALAVQLDGGARHDAPAVMSTLTEAIGAPCWLVGVASKVVHANHSAKLILEAGNGVELADGRLKLWDQQADQLLRETLERLDQSAWSARFRMGAEILSQRPAGGAALVVVVAPLGVDNPIAAVSSQVRCAVFVLEEKLRPNGQLPQRLRRLYGLTVAESEVSIDLASGLGLSEIARERGTAVATVRAQVKAVLSKTNVRRQADLAALINRLRF